MWHTYELPNQSQQNAFAVPTGHLVLHFRVLFFRVAISWEDNFRGVSVIFPNLDSVIHIHISREGEEVDTKPNHELFNSMFPVANLMLFKTSPSL